MMRSERAVVRKVLSQAIRMPTPQESPAPRGGSAGRVVPPRGQAVAKCDDCGARHFGICDAMPELHLDLLAAAAVIATRQPGQRFIEEGAAADHFFTISEGTARVFKALPDGRQQIVSFAGRGDFLGLAVSSAYAYSVEAIDAVAYCRFSRPVLRSLLTDFPAMEKRLMDVTCHELTLAQEQMLLLGRKSARERLASFLILRLGKVTPGAVCRRHGIDVSLPMTRSDIADYLGMRIETVSRTLTRMKADGLIRPGATAFGIVVTNLAALSACASGEPQNGRRNTQDL
jgi:CRP/FNR family transcriptional regulator